MSASEKFERAVECGFIAACLMRYSGWKIVSFALTGYIDSHGKFVFEHAGNFDGIRAERPSNSTSGLGGPRSYSPHYDEGFEKLAEDIARHCWAGSDLAQFRLLAAHDCHPHDGEVVKKGQVPVLDSEQEKQFQLAYVAVGGTEIEAAGGLAFAKHRPDLAETLR